MKSGIQCVVVPRETDSRQVEVRCSLLRVKQRSELENGQLFQLSIGVFVVNELNGASGWDTYQGNRE